MQKYNSKFKKNILYLLSVSLLFSFYSFLSPLVLAQQVTLSITPPLLELVIKPGKSVLIAYKIGNLSDPTVLKSRVLPFEPTDHLGNINIKEEFEGPVRFSLDNANIQLDQPFFINTRSSQQLLLRIRVPEGAPEGDYYYTFFGETQPSFGSEGVSSSLAQARIGSNILITVTKSGRIDVKGKIAQFDVLPRFSLDFFGKKVQLFDSTDKIPVVLTAANAGTNLIRPDGSITLKGNFGEKATFDVLPQNILAKSERLLTATPSAQVDCEGRERSLSYCKKPTSLILSGFFIGNYRLSAKLRFAEGSPSVSGQTSFFALPFKFILGFIAIVIVSLLLIHRLRRE